MPVNDVKFNCGYLSVQDSLFLKRTNGHCELDNSDQFGINASTFVLSYILQAANQLIVSNHFRYHSKSYGELRNFRVNILRDLVPI